MLSPLRSDEAVSPVIAAVLIFALGSTAFFLWSINSLPEWISENEHQHQLDVQNAFVGLETELEALSSLDSSGPATQPIELGATKVPWWQRFPSSGSLGFVGGSEWTMQMPSGSLHMSGGRPIGQPDAAIAGNTLTNVQDLRALLVDHQWTGTGEFVQVVADDSPAAGSMITTLTATITYNAASGDCTGAELRLTIQLNVGGTLSTPSDEVVACGLSGASGRVIDLLNDGPHFRGNLDRLLPGYTITLTEDGGGATSRANAVWIDRTGNEQFLGSGEAAASTTKTVSTSFLRFDPTNIHYIDQRVDWEFGAVIADQDDGQSIAGRPTFRLKVDDATDTGFLRWTVVDLTGDGAVAGATTAAVSVRHTGTDSFLFRTTDPLTTFTIKGEHAAAWNEFFGGRFALQGTGTAATSVQAGDLTTLSLVANPAGPVASWVIDLRIIHAEGSIR